MILRSGDSAAAVVVGTLPRPLARATRKSVSVAMYLTSSQASSGFFEVLGMPVTVPPTLPEPYSGGCVSATGNGAVP